MVDTDLIETLYRRVYQEKVLGSQRLRLLNVSRLTAAEETAGRVAVTVESLLTGERTVLDADVLVCATGYRPPTRSRCSASSAGRCHHDEQGRAVVDRDYRIRTDAGVRAGIYLQGGTEHTHGISSSLLSNTAIRSAEILESVCGRRPAAPVQPTGPAHPLGPPSPPCPRCPARAEPAPTREPVHPTGAAGRARRGAAHHGPPRPGTRAGRGARHRDPPTAPRTPEGIAEATGGAGRHQRPARAGARRVRRGARRGAAC